MTFKLNLFPSVNMETIEKDGARRYITPNGDVYESVTTVIGKYADKSGLDVWRKRVGVEEAAKITRIAVSRGNSMHKMFEKYLLNDPTYADGVMPTTQILFDSLKPYIDENVKEVYGIEYPLWSDYLQTAGKTDFLASYGGLKSVLDFKTSNRPKKIEWIKGYFQQITAYSMMVEERTGIPFPQVVLMIAVDHEPPQVFVESSYTRRKETIQLFRNNIRSDQK
jgi:genome maintenance exonuclease 1